MEEIKMLPYGISDFEDLRSQNMYYADKTKYIPLLELAGDFLFLVRPRRFGKSIFLSMLRCYYDTAMQQKFDTLFDGLWIKDNPTRLKGRYQTMYFDFSQVVSRYDNLITEFNKYCSNQLIWFAKQNAAYYDSGFYEDVVSKAPDSIDQLRYICSAAKSKGISLYLIIDEYDNFTNDALNEKGESVYLTLNHDTYFYQNVFKIYKTNFQRIIYMGINPISLNGLTSGFCIAWDLCSDPRFNMMLGFSETEVREMISYYNEAGMIKADREEMIEEMKSWYGNYCFSKESLETDSKIFNSETVIHYLKYHILYGKSPINDLDSNTQYDYKILEKLMELDSMTDRERSLIKRIAKEGKIRDHINTTIPAECIFDRENFVNLLYFYGLLTIIGIDLDRLVLGIPNNNVLKQYYEYLLTGYKLTSEINT